MKNKFLIHIGYPKTATTTFQKSLFQKLYNDGIIEYSQKNFNEELLDFVLEGNSFFHNKKTDKLYVISDETIVMSSPFQEDVLKRINLLGEKIDILVVIRNHSDLIYSWYVQIMPDIFSNVSKYWNEFLEKGSHKNFFENFFFYKQIMKFKNKCKNVNIHLLLFEDLQYKEKFFFKSIANILNVEVSYVESCFNIKYNVKSKKNNYYVNNITLQTFLSRIIYKSGFFLLYKKYFRKIDFIKTLFRITYKNVDRVKFFEKEFEKFDEKTKQQIRDFFREDTMKLIKEFNLDEEKMKKYGYI